MGEIVQQFERYGIRDNFKRFAEDADLCLRGVEKFLESKRNAAKDLENLLEIQQRVAFLAGMCKGQNLNIIGKANPFIQLSGCSNRIITVKSELIEDPKSKYILPIMKEVETVLTDLIENVNSKINRVIYSEDEQQDTLEQKVVKMRERNVPETLINQYKETVEKQPATPDELLYKQLNEKLLQEKRNLKSKLAFVEPNKCGIIEGSVAVHSFFKPDAIAKMPHSVIKFPGISYNHNKREVITPLHVFHKQILVAVHVQALVFKFRKKPLTPKERQKRIDDQFNRLRAVADRAIYMQFGPMVNFTDRFPNGYMLSKVFKDFRFLWFVTLDMEHVLQNYQDNTARLMWE